MTSSLASSSATDVSDRIRRATKEVLEKQLGLGLDVVTDGEMSRENYYLHFCRRLEGVDMDKCTTKVMREGETSLKCKAWF